VLPLLGVGCATTSEEDEDTVDPPDPVSLRERLQALPPVEGEVWLTFLERAYEVSVTPEESYAIARIRDGDRRSPEAKAALPPLVSSWARKSTGEARVALLSKLIAHRTYHEEGNSPPGNSPAFRAFEADIKAFAVDHTLDFTTVQHIAYEVGVSGSRRRSNRRKVGVLAHADVVPADEPGWESDPFVAKITDDAIYGRGALDDKGAIVASLFAITAMSHAGAVRQRLPVLIIGTSEETHWDGIDRFVAKRGAPSRVFVADGSFPLSVGEKGVATATVKVKETASADGPGFTLLDLKGGQVSNQVPATAWALLQGTPEDVARVAADESHKAWATTRVENGYLVVETGGKAAHGATPGEGENAIQRMLRFLTVHAPLKDTPCGRLLALLDEKLDGEHDAARLGLGDVHERFSPATVNIGTLRLAEGVCEAKLNLRWPPPKTAKQAVDAVRNAIVQAAGGTLDLDITGGGLDPFLIEGDVGFTSALRNAYTAVTGEPAEEVTLSGTTYAKAIPGGAVTFGPSGPKVSGDRIHGPNEHITLEELGMLVEVYAWALTEMGLE
jgi:succinyl-diaminopimelate desuccinylase